MGRVRVVTDSSANIPLELVRDLDIQVVPLMLNVGGDILRDGVDITPGEFYRKQREQKFSAKTSSPSVADFLHAYTAQPVPREGIVSIHLPSRLSGTLEVARTASSLIDEADVQVVDAQSVAIAQGFVVIGAARAAYEGKDIRTVIESAQRIALKVHFFAMLDTLEYLHRGGRIGGVQALMGMMLRIKPIVYLVDGRVEPLAKTRTKTKALDFMLERIKLLSGGCPIHAAVLHSDAGAEAEDFRSRIEKRFDCLELYVTELTPVMGAHSGPGVLGLAFYAD